MTPAIGLSDAAVVCLAFAAVALTYALLLIWLGAIRAIQETADEALPPHGLADDRPPGSYEPTPIVRRGPGGEYTSTWPEERS